MAAFRLRAGRLPLRTRSFRLAATIVRLTLPVFGFGFTFLVFTFLRSCYRLFLTSVFFVRPGVGLGRLVFFLAFLLLAGLGLGSGFVAVLRVGRNGGQKKQGENCCTEKTNRSHVHLLKLLY